MNELEDQLNKKKKFMISQNSKKITKNYKFCDRHGKTKFKNGICSQCYYNEQRRKKYNDERHRIAQVNIKKF